MSSHSLCSCPRPHTMNEVLANRKGKTESLLHSYTTNHLCSYLAFSHELTGNGTKNHMLSIFISLTVLVSWKVLNKNTYWINAGINKVEIDPTLLVMTVSCPRVFAHAILSAGLLIPASHSTYTHTHTHVNNTSLEGTFQTTLS